MREGVKPNKNWVDANAKEDFWKIPCSTEIFKEEKANQNYAIAAIVWNQNYPNRSKECWS